MTPPEFIRSVYAAMLDNGITMAETDRMEYGLYMQIVRERARRRWERKWRGEQDGAAAPPNRGDNAVYLRRGTIDEVW